MCGLKRGWVWRAGSGMGALSLSMRILFGAGHVEVLFLSIYLIYKYLILPSGRAAVDHELKFMAI
jgi:hypothetical protein